MSAGLRTPNLPAGNLIEVLGHQDIGGARALARMPVDLFVDAIRDLVVSDPSGIAGVVTQLTALQTVVAAQGGNVASLLANLANLTAQLTALQDIVTGQGGNVADLLAGLTNLTTFAQSVANGLADELAARDQAVAGVYSAVAASNSAIAASNSAIFRNLVSDRFRPGDTPAAFTASAAGGPNEALPAFAGTIVPSPAGKAVQFYGEDLIVSREYVRLEPGHLHAVRAVVRRTVNAADPTNDTVRFVAYWYDGNLGALSDASSLSIIGDIGDLAVESGEQEIVGGLGTSTGTRATVIAPDGAVYYRLALKVFGGDQRTNIETIGWHDVTDADLYSPDLSSVLSRLLGLESANLPARTGALESAVGSPSNSTFVSRLAAQGGAMPSSSSILRLLGFTDAGDGGAGDWALVPSEPAHQMKVKVGSRWFAFAGPTLAAYQAGAIDDDADGSRQRNADAFFRATSYLGTTARKVLRVQNRRAGVYRLPTGTALILDGITLDVDPGVRLKGNVVPGESLRVTREVWIDFDDGATVFSYALSPTWGRPPAEKGIWLNQGDLARREIAAVDASGMSHEMIVWPGSDAWAADTTIVAGSTNSGRITRNLENDGRWHVSFTPVRGGDRLTWAFSDFAGSRGAFVRTTAGFFCFYSNDTGPGVYAYKRPGVAAVIVGGQDWAGRGDLQSRQPRYAKWSVRVYSHRKWSVLFDGVEVFLPQDVAQGEIIQAGPAVFGDRALDGVAVTSITRVRETEASGKPPIRILGEGDSTMAAIYGALTGALREALDGSMGIRILGITNRAVVGNNSGDMANRIQAQGAGGANYAILKIGRNDVQGGTADVDTVSIPNLSGAIDKLLSEFCTPVLCIPGLWYGQAQAGGRGAATTRYEKGARLRAAMLRLAAIKGIPFYEEDMEQGLILPVYLNTPEQTDPLLRDSIHQSNAGYRRDGYNLARIIADHFLLPMTRRVPEDSPLTTASLSIGGTLLFGPTAGWDASTATYGVADDGRVSLGGYINAPSSYAGASGPVAIYRLPPNIRPRAIKRIQARTFAGNVPLDVQGDGYLVVAGPPSNTGYVSLDGISFAAA